MNDPGIAIYVRVSTTRQDLRAQEPELKAWIEGNAGKRKVTWYRDKHTGRSMDRPAINRLDRDVEADKIGTIVVWRNDRMGRRARQLLEFLERLDDLKIDYISLRDGGHLTGKSASARMFRHMLVGMAEYESSLISERTRAALDAKRARGETWGGRKPGTRYKVTPQKLKAIRALLAQGIPKTEIARQLGIGRTTLYQALKLL